jgi:hypothetical protein
MAVCMKVLFARCTNFPKYLGVPMHVLVPLPRSGIISQTGRYALVCLCISCIHVAFMSGTICAGMWLLYCQVRGF